MRLVKKKKESLNVLNETPYSRFARSAEARSKESRLAFLEHCERESAEESQDVFFRIASHTAPSWWPQD
jgi:hypothetical protein